MQVNFFWKGDSFDLIHRISILSHYLVGHDVVVWLSGNRPNSQFWVDDYSDVIKIKNADEIINIDDFLKSGGNFKTGSALWRYTYLYQYGGTYCDTDVIALTKFPDDKWIIVSGEKPENGYASNSIIRVPKNELFLKESIENIRAKWGNVIVFSDAYKKYYGTPIKYTHPNRMFHPFQFNERAILFSNLSIPGAYSVHICHTFFDRRNIFIDWNYINQFKNTMLHKIVYHIQEKLERGDNFVKCK